MGETDLISRQAAVDCMMRLQREDEEAYGASIPEGFDGDRAAEALMQLPSVQTGPLTVNFAREMDRETIERLKDEMKNAPVLIMAVNDSVQPEQKWIPCSERLPEIGQSVLLSVGGMYSAEGCLREDGDWAQFRWDAIQRKDMVGAWKPLPEPYKGEQE